MTPAAYSAIIGPYTSTQVDGSTELAEVFAQGMAQHRLRRTNGSVVYGLFELVGEEEQALLAGEIRRLEGFLGGEFLPSRTHTPFTRALK